MQSCYMNVSESALEHLKTIRALMERATIYRAISAPTSLAGGFLAILLGSFATFAAPDSWRTSGGFFLVWLFILIITSLFNLWLVTRQSPDNGSGFFSPRFIQALKDMAPALLSGAWMGAGVWFITQSLPACALVWMSFYALALFATFPYSPRSMILLGWAFFLAAPLASLILWLSHGHLPSDGGLAHALMAGTFGVIHVIYGLTVLATARKAREIGQPLTGDPT
jgi:hypothetical protein